MSVLGLLGDVASGVSSAGGIFNTIKGIFGSNPTQQDLMNWQEKMLDKQFAFQSEHAQLNRDFQADQVKQAQDWNSIVSQVKRAQQAGVNPYSLVASGSYGSAAGSPTGSGSQVGGAVIPQPAPNTRLQDAQSFSAIAAAMSNLADAKQKGVNTDYMEQAMNDLLLSNKLKNDYQGLANGFQQIVNKWQDLKSKNEVSEIIARCDNLSAQTDLSVHQVDVQKAQIFELATRAGLNREQYRQVRRFLDSFFDSYYQSIINKNKAETRESYSKASLNDAQTDLTNSQKSLTDVHKQLSDLQLSVEKASNSQQKNAAIKQYANLAVQAGIMTEQMKVALELAIKNKNWYEVKQIMGIITSAADAFSKVRGSGSYGSGSSGSGGIVVDNPYSPY